MSKQPKDPNSPTHQSIATRNSTIKWEDRLAAIDRLIVSMPGLNCLALKDPAWQIRRAAIWMGDLTDEQISAAMIDESAAVRAAAVARFHPRISPQQAKDALRTRSLLDAYCKSVFCLSKTAKLSSEYTETEHQLRCM